MCRRFSYCFNKRNEVTQLNKTWLNQSTIYPFIIHFHGKPFPFKTSKIRRQGHEKSLHNFKKNICK